MSESANVKSLDSVRFFASAVLQFQEEARLCVTQLEMELRRILGWLERERPRFWKQEIEICRRRQSEARVTLHKCRMRHVGDFRPSCFEEKKHLQQCKDELDFAQKQVAVIRRWTTVAHQEADEYRGRAVQLVQAIERDIPRLLALLRHSIERLEGYRDVQLPPQSLARTIPAETASDTKGEDGPNAPDPTAGTDGNESEKCGRAVAEGSAANPCPRDGESTQ